MVEKCRGTDVLTFGEKHYEKPQCSPSLSHKRPCTTCKPKTEARCVRTAVTTCSDRWPPTSCYRSQFSQLSNERSLFTSWKRHWANWCISQFKLCKSPSQSSVRTINLLQTEIFTHVANRSSRVSEIRPLVKTFASSPDHLRWASQSRHRPQKCHDRHLEIIHRWYG